MFGAPANAINFTLGLRVAARRGRHLRDVRQRHLVQERQRRLARLERRDRQPVPDACPAGRTSGASRPTSCAGIGTITFRSMPSDATLLIVVTDWTTGTWKAPNFSGIGMPGRPDPARLPDRDVADAVRRQRDRRGLDPRPARRGVTADALQRRGPDRRLELQPHRRRRDPPRARSREIKCVHGDQADADARRRRRRPTPTPTPDARRRRRPDADAGQPDADADARRRPRRPRPRRPRRPRRRPPRPPSPSPRRPSPRPTPPGRRPVAPGRREPRSRSSPPPSRASRPRPSSPASQACVKTTKTIKVNGTRIRSVAFTLDGRKLRTVKRHRGDDKVTVASAQARLPQAGRQGQLHRRHEPRR